MAFSLFGKKPPQKIGEARPPVRPAGAKPQPAAAPKAAEEELPALDFTLGGMTIEGGPKGSIEVEESGTLVPPAVEQAAMLYAAGQPIEACRPLEAAIRGPGLGAFEKRAWGMLFDLYQAQGKRESFDALALEFAARFETSPPTWHTDGPETKDLSLSTGGRAFVALSGALNAKAQESLKQLLRMAEKNPVVRLDMAKLTDADEGGCALLLAALQAVKKARRECVLGGADRLAAILAKKISTGRRDMEPVWLLLLELYQQLFQQDAFEETAVNYAITFEVSPPSWIPPAAKRPAAPAAVAAAATAAPAEGDGYPLEGDIASAGVGTFASLTAFAESREEVPVDCRQLLRMDFVSAAQLLNVVANLQAAGKKVRLRGVSHLVAALWEVLGFDRVATIETRKN